MNLQYMLSNGTWADCGERAEEFLGYAVEVHGSREKVLQLLSTGKTVRIRGSDWYDNIRIKPAKKPLPPLPEQERCVVCGTWQPKSRFTTLPANAHTCDDCA